MSIDLNDPKIAAAAEKFLKFLNTGGHHATVGLRSAQAACYAKEEGLKVGESDEFHKDPTVQAVLEKAAELRRNS